MTEKSAKPQLRFAGFDDTWEQRELGSITSSYSGGTPTAGKAEYYDGDIPFIRSGEINEEKTELFLSELGYKNSSAAMVEKGDILYALYGATSGEVSISKLKGAINQAILAIKPNEGYDSEFLMQWLRNQKDNIISTYLQGGQGNLSGTIVKSLKVDITTYDEQQAIGAYFRNLDNLITLHQRKYDKLTNVKKSMLEKMFPKNGSNVPEIRFKGFSDAWEQRKLGNAVDVQSGRDYKHLVEGDIPVYGTGGYMLSVNEALSYKQDAIGIGRKGTIDKPYILKAPFWTVDTLFYAFPKGKNELNFLNCIFQNIDWKKKDESTGVPSLSKTTINDVDIYVPEEEEQKAIGEYFLNIDNLITLHQRELEKLKNLKKACLEKMFV